MGTAGTSSEQPRGRDRSPVPGAIAGLGLSAVIVVLLALLGRLGGNVSPALPAPSSGPQAGWILYRDGEGEFTVAYPPSWQRATERLTPTLAQPHDILALGTYQLRSGGERCANWPERALEDLGPSDALVWVLERTGMPFTRGGRGFPPRPAHFGPKEGTGSDESPGCLSRPKEFFHRWIPFQDRGRRFYGYLALGPEATQETAGEAWAILDSLEFDPGPEAAAPPDCGVTEISPEEYTTMMLPNRGPPGTGVVLSGPTLRDESGRYAPADRVEVWWNTRVPRSEVPDSPPLTPGPAFLLAREDIRARCTFSVFFRIPQVPPGPYQVRIFVFDEGGYGVFLGHRFEVTQSRISGSSW
jgi:hypothetical protein